MAGKIVLHLPSKCDRNMDQMFGQMKLSFDLDCISFAYKSNLLEQVRAPRGRIGNVNGKPLSL